MLSEHVGAPLLLHTVRRGHEGRRGSGSDGRRGTGEFWQGVEAENGDAAGEGQGGGKKGGPLLLCSASRRGFPGAVLGEGHSRALEMLHEKLTGALKLRRGMWLLF